MSEPVLYKAEECGRQLGVARSTFYDWSMRGLFPKPVAEKPFRWTPDQIIECAQIMDRWITKKEIAEWLGVDEFTINGWHREIPMPKATTRQGNSVFKWDWAAIQEWASNFVEWEEDQ